MVQRTSIARVATYLFAGCWAVMTLYPLLFTWFSAFKSTDEIFYRPFALPEVWRFDNYAASFGEHAMLLSIGNSLFFAGAGVAVLLVVAAMASFVIARYRLFWVTPLFLFFALGIMIPIHSTLIPLVRLINGLRIANRYSSLVMVYTAFNLPLAILILSGFMRELPRELEESAIIDGAGAVQILFRITVPLSTPALATVGILTFQAIYNDLIFALLFITKRGMYTISLTLLRFQGNWNVELGPIFAAIVVAIVPMIIVYVLFQERIERGLSAGALKG